MVPLQERSRSGCAVAVLTFAVSAHEVLTAQRSFHAIHPPSVEAVCWEYPWHNVSTL